MQMQPTIVTPTNTNKPEDNNKDEENEDSKRIYYKIIKNLSYTFL